MHSVEEAISTLLKVPESKIIAGGTDLLVKIREGALAGCELVSIGGIKELRGITLDSDENIHIGPLTTFREIQNSPIIKERIPVLGQAVATVGSPQVRAVGTIGGNVSNGFTTADSPPSLFTLNARMAITGPSGTREIPISEYYLAPEKTAPQEGELLTDVIIRKADYAGYHGHYIKYAIRNSMDIAILSCCVNVRLSPDKKALEDIRIAFGAAGPLPLRAVKTEAALRNMPIGQELLYKISDLAPTQDVSPISDRRASKDFRLQLISVLSQDALKAAIEKAGGQMNA